MNEKRYSLFYPWLATSDTHPVRCCLCQSVRGEVVSTFIVNKDEFHIRRCPNDGLMYLSPQPGSHYRQQLYNHPTYFVGSDDMYGVATDDIKSMAVAKVRLDEICRYAPDARSILEFGCAQGNVLLEAAHRGFERVQGVEFSDDAVRHCRDQGLSVLTADMDHLPEELTAKRFDVVAGYSILEHLEDPFVFIQRVKEFLMPQGILVLRVPDTDPIQGPTLSLLDHFWHFTRASLKQMLEQAGFDVLDIFASGTFQGIQHPGILKSMTIIARYP